MDSLDSESMNGTRWVAKAEVAIIIYLDSGIWRFVKIKNIEIKV
jgi:hypothetical protein